MVPDLPSRLVWQSAAVWPVGYARYSSQILKGLDARGVEVAYRYVYRDSLVCGSFQEPQDTGDAVINRLKRNPADPDLPQVVCAGPDLFSRNFGRYRIGLATTEVNGIPKDWVEACNRMDEVWVLSPFNERAFRDSGVTRPIVVIPGGVDPQQYYPGIKGYPLKDHFCFLSVFEWSERKAPEVLLRAFNREFKDGEDAFLLCKVMVPPWAPFDVPSLVKKLRLSPQGGRVVVDLNTYLPSSQLGSLYCSADCFVLPTRGEGWGLPVFEALACGLPVIATNWGALQGYLSEDFSYPLKVKKLSVALEGKYPYSGYQWAEPDEEHLRYLLRHVFEHREEAREKGFKGSRFVHQELTWDRAVAKVLERLERIPGSAGGSGNVSGHQSQRSLRIGIDASRTIPPKERAGIGTYTCNLIEGLSRVDARNQYVLYPGFGEFVHPQYGAPWDLEVHRQDNFTVYRGLLPAFGPNRKRQAGWKDGEPVSVVHATAFSSPDVSPAKLVYTVFDLTYRLFPEYHLPSNVAFCESQVREALKKAERFIAISDQTRRDFLEAYGVDDSRVIRVCLGVSRKFDQPLPDEVKKSVMSRYRLPPDYILTLGSLEPRKNLSLLLQAYAGLKPEAQRAHPLVVAGCAGWLNSDIRALVDKLKLGQKVHFLGYVGDDDLPALYRGACLFVYPSLYEGFGLPVLEAMTCGVPVAVSRCSSLPEVAGEAGLFFDPYQEEDLASQLQRAVSDSSLCDDLKHRSLLQAQKFSVERMAVETLRVYEQAASGG